MGENFEKKHYNSGWRPLCKENFTGSDILVETSNKLSNKATENNGNVQTPSQSLLNNQEELVQALAAISNEVKALDKKIIDQSKKLDHILSILDKTDPDPLEKHSDDSAPGLRLWGLFSSPRQ